MNTLYALVNKTKCITMSLNDTYFHQSVLSFKQGYFLNEPGGRTFDHVLIYSHPGTIDPPGCPHPVEFTIFKNNLGVSRW